MYIYIQIGRRCPCGHRSKRLVTIFYRYFWTMPPRASSSFSLNAPMNVEIIRNRLPKDPKGILKARRRNAMLCIDRRAVLTSAWGGEAAAQEFKIFVSSPHKNTMSPRIWATFETNFGHFSLLYIKNIFSIFSKSLGGGQRKCLGEGRCPLTNGAPVYIFY